jgi:hypothetical protein
VPGLDESLISYIFKLGYHSPENLLNAHADDLAAIPGISEEMAMQIQQIAYEVKKQRDEELRRAKEEAALAQAAAAAAPAPSPAAGPESEATVAPAEAEADTTPAPEPAAAPEEGK